MDADAGSDALQAPQQVESQRRILLAPDDERLRVGPRASCELEPSRGAQRAVVVEPCRERPWLPERRDVRLDVLLRERPAPRRELSEHPPDRREVPGREQALGKGRQVEEDDVPRPEQLRWAACLLEVK